MTEREQGIPDDVPDVELGHHDDRCSFDALFVPETHRAAVYVDSK